MGFVPSLAYPTTGTALPGPLTDNDDKIRTVVNGNIDADNLATGAVTSAKILDGTIVNADINASAGIVDTKLASPNNSAYKNLLVAQALAATDLAAGTYPLQHPGSRDGASVEAMLASGASISMDESENRRSAAIVPMLYFDDADFTVGSLTQKLRLRAQVNTNATAWSSVTATFGLYPVTFAGAADTLSITLGTVVAGSTVAIANPTASGTSQSNSGDFTIPSDGQYCIGVVTSATLTNNAAALLTAQLQTRNV